MLLDVSLVVKAIRILGDLSGDVPVLSHEIMETVDVIPIKATVAVEIAAAILGVVISVFRIHERGRIGAYCSCKLRMILKEILQLRMVLDELAIID